MFLVISCNSKKFCIISDSTDEIVELVKNLLAQNMSLDTCKMQTTNL